MMQSTSYIVGHTQADGRKYVKATFTLDSGEVLVREFGPTPTVDYAAEVTAMATQIDAAIVQSRLGKIECRPLFDFSDDL